MKRGPDTVLPWYRLAARALPTHVLLKSIGIPALFVIFFVAYFHLLNHPAYPVTVMPLTWPDRWVGFSPLALPLYVSLWVYITLPPAFIADRRELLAYATGIGGACLAGLVIFYFWPTAVAPSDIDWAQYPALDFLKNMDAAGNACPSLHVATAVFSGLWLQRLLRRCGSPPWARVVNALWCGGIVYSALATRQHVAVDVWAGLLLGMLAAWLSLRHRIPAAPAGSAHRAKAPRRAPL